MLILGGFASFYGSVNTHANTAKVETMNLVPDVQGVVLDSDGKPVVGATVRVEGTMLGTTTSSKGTFELYRLSPGSYNLKVTAVGFKPITESIQVEPGTDVPPRIELRFTTQAVESPEIVVIGRSDGLFTGIPGSARQINEAELRALAPISGNEALRRSTGLNVVDEEGMGLRLNVGIRGLDPDRSRTVLVLEDGVPVALAPYGEPELYYTPSIERMSGVEILKGSGQILFGPQTIGGVINYITMRPPTEESATARLTIAENGYANAIATYGNTFGNVGFVANLATKRADKLGMTRFNITDVNLKAVLSLSEKSTIALKTQVYDETSNATYVGLTQTMYDGGGQDFVHLAPNDELRVKRYSLSLNHDYSLAPTVNLKSVAYYYTTSRNWRRQDFALNGKENTKPGNWTGEVWGDTAVENGALFMRNSTGNRNRQFEVAGLESRLDYDFNLGGVAHNLNVGIRYLFEQALEQRVNGTKSDAVSGNLVEDEIRSGTAWSAYAQNKSTLFDGFVLNYGLRMEYFDYERDILRRNFSINGTSTLRDTNLVRSSNIQQIIPGGGFSWQIQDNLNLFAGAHTGFAPPRTKDAISNVGDVYELEAERSINLELGVRTELLKGLALELTAFRMNFDNQVIPVSESSGGIGAGLVNAGQTVHQGIEAGVVIDISQFASMTSISIVFDANLTLVDAKFKGERIRNEVDISGNKIPYAPSHLLNSAVTIGTVAGVSFRLGINQVGEQLTDVDNTVGSSNDGRNGVLPAYTVVDATLGYIIPGTSLTLQLIGKNLTDQRYITTRRPQGIRVGLPRMFMIGADIRL